MSQHDYLENVHDPSTVVPGLALTDESESVEKPKLTRRKVIRVPKFQVSPLQITLPSTPDNTSPTRNNCDPSFKDDSEQPLHSPQRIEFVNPVSPQPPSMETESSTADSLISVQFVRKPAYVSGPRPRLSFPTTHVEKTIDGRTSPYQILPATPSHFAPSSGEPKVKHLPHRRKSMGSIQQFDSTFQDYENYAKQPGALHSPPPSHAVVGQSDQMTNSVDRTSPVISSNQTPSTRTQFYAKLFSDEFWNPLRSVEIGENLFSQAGEAYKSLALADKQITKQLAMHKSHNSSQPPPAIMNTDLSHRRITDVNLNEENKVDQPDNATWSSQRNQQLTTQVDVSVSKSKPGAANHWIQLRNLCRPYRSEQNISADLSNAFLSRQCLCRILAIDRQANKPYQWKPYFMSINGEEVRFIKASAKLNGISYLSKYPAGKQSSTPVTDRRKPTNTVAEAHEQSSNESPISGQFRDKLSHTAPVDKPSSSCIILPIRGFVWHPEELPIDFPNWNPLGTTPSPSIHTTPTRSSIIDPMNPVWTGISEMQPHTSSQSVTVDRNRSTTRDWLRCYRFAHIPAGAELLFVFPDEGAALTCLQMCQVHGGKQLSLPTADTLLLKDGQTGADKQKIRNPYIPSLIVCNPKKRTKQQLSYSRNSLELPVSRLTKNKDTPSNQFDNAKNSLSSRINVDEVGMSSSVSSLPQVGKTFADVALEHEDEVSSEPTSPYRRAANVPRPGLKTPIIQTVKQLFNWSSPIEIEERSSEMLIAAVLADPPDFSTLENPGPVFGSPLHAQVQSIDHPFVPVLLQAFITALESHGLSLPGLYRKSGRQRSINQFVCIANLAPNNVDLLISLDAWREPYALCSLVKQFLRRLPVRLLTLDNWEALLSLVPEKDCTDVDRLAYLLLSMRTKLRRMTTDAFGHPSGRCLRLDSKLDSYDTDLNNTAMIGISSVIVDSLRLDNSDVDRFPAKSRWATLGFIMQHLRNVVSHEDLNEVNYQCCAVCYGPVLFEDSIHVDKFNIILELLLRHWPWLIKDLHTKTEPNLSYLSSCFQSSQDSLLQETVEYLKQYGSSTTPKTSDLSNAQTESPLPSEDEIISSVQSLLRRSFQSDIPRTPISVSFHTPGNLAVKNPPGVKKVSISAGKPKSRATIHPSLQKGDWKEAVVRNRVVNSQTQSVQRTKSTYSPFTINEKRRQCRFKEI